MISFIQCTCIILISLEEESRRFPKRVCVLFPNEMTPSPGILIVTQCKHQISRNVKWSDVVLKIVSYASRILTGMSL